MPRKTKSKMTTIAISKDSAAKLAGMRRGFEDYDAVVARLLNNQFDIPVGFISIDNELPQLHTCIIQLGEDPESLYFYTKDGFKQITLQDANVLMKQPKPNLVLSSEDVLSIYNDRGWGFMFSSFDSNEHPRAYAVRTRMKQFLENQPK